MTKEQFFEKYSVLAKKRKYNIGKSSVTAGKVKELEKKHKIMMPEEYINFISAASHNISALNGVIDNFCFEDGVKIKLEIPTQPFNNELLGISELFSNPSCGRYLQAGYIPIGFFEDEAYILCHVFLKVKNMMLRNAMGIMDDLVENFIQRV